MADRREDEAIRTDRPAGVVARRRAAHRARDPHARRRRARRARGARRAATRSTRACAGCTSPTARASPGCSTAASCCCRPGRAGRPSPASSRRSSTELVDAGLAGLVLELGVHYRYVPAVVEAAAREHGLALVALHREVKFVTLTEAVHSRIISEQTAALRARDEVRERFTALALRGSPADFIVHQLAQTLGARGRAREPRPRGRRRRGAARRRGGAVHAAGRRRSRRAHRQREQRRARGARRRGPTTWLIVPVEARGIRWGHLIALPGPGAPRGSHERARAGRHRARARAARRRRRRRVGAHRPAAPGRRAARRAVRRARAVRPRGSRRPACPSTGARLYGIVATGAPVARRGGGCRGARARRARARRRGARPRRSASPATASCCCRCPTSSFDDAAARAFASRARRAATRHPSTGSCSRSAARPTGLDGLLGSVQEAIDLARAPAPAARARARAAARRRPPAHAARHLAARRPPAAASTASGCSRRSSSTTSRAAATCSTCSARCSRIPGNRTAAASASHLSRSVFYQRLALIGDLLGVDLDDGETLTALHLALLVRRSAAR